MHYATATVSSSRPPIPAAGLSGASSPRASPLTACATSRVLDRLDYTLRFNTPRAYVHPLDRAIHIDSDLLDVCTKSPWRPVMRMADVLTKSS